MLYRSKNVLGDQRISNFAKDYSSRQWRGGRDVGSEGPVAAVVPGPAVHSGAAAAAAEARRQTSFWFHYWNHIISRNLIAPSPIE